MMNRSENNSKGIFSNVQVTVRMKPCSKNTNSMISKVKNYPKLIKVCNESFSFDNIKWGNESQERVYKAAAYPFVEKALDGYSATIMTFGQIGSGKSYTMGSLASTTKIWRTSGLIQRCLKHIFEQSNVEVWATFVEIDNDQFHDLLDTDAPIVMHEGHGAIGPKIEKISSCREGLLLVRKALALRQERLISSNGFTSQSHAILTLRLTVNYGDYSRMAKLNLVDLAGIRTDKCVESPTEKPLGVECWMNRGLFALNKVITAMSERKNLVPILCERNLLTRILKDSLDTKSQISLVVCLSSKSSDYNANLQTLNFAKRAKLVKIDPIQRSIANSTDHFADQLKATTQQLSELLSPVSSDIAILKENRPERRLVKAPAERKMKNCTVMVKKSDANISNYRKIQEYKENIEPINNTNNKTNVQNTQSLLTANEAVLSLASTVSISQSQTQSDHETFSKVDSIGSKRCNCPSNTDDKFLSSHSECEIVKEMKLELSESEVTMQQFSTSQEFPSSDQFYEKPGTSYATRNQMQRMNAVSKSNFVEFSNERTLGVRRFHETGSSQVAVHYPNKFLKTDKKRLAVTVDKKKIFCKCEDQSYEYDDNRSDKYLNLSLKDKKLAHNKNILRFLNSGNPKLLATLPQIGIKTAIIIYNYRLINGEFNSLKDLENIPTWSKKFCKKFFAANNISFE